MRSKKLQILLASLGLLLFSNVQAGSLHEAVYDRDFESVKSLLKKGADVNQIGLYRDGSALHLAARSGQQEIAQLLIDSGATVDIRDLSDYTPLHNAAWNGNLDIVKLLLNSGADITARNYSGLTPLACAYRNNQIEVIEFIEGKLQSASN
jgi:ankyrin repeat protein